MRWCGVNLSHRLGVARDTALTSGDEYSAPTGSTLLSAFEVAVHGEGLLHRRPGALVDAEDDPDLPHARPAFTHEPEP